MYGARLLTNLQEFGSGSDPCLIAREHNAWFKVRYNFITMTLQHKEYLSRT